MDELVAAVEAGHSEKLRAYLVKGGVNPWRGAVQNRSAHAYVYPGPPGASIFNSSSLPLCEMPPVDPGPAGGVRSRRVARRRAGIGGPSAGAPIHCASTSGQD